MSGSLVQLSVLHPKFCSSRESLFFWTYGVSTCAILIQVAYRNVFFPSLERMQLKLILIKTLFFSISPLSLGNVHEY